LTRPDASAGGVAASEVLKAAGLLIDEQAGKDRISRVDPDGLPRVRAQLEGF
jgi:hypothetical protein